MKNFSTNEAVTVISYDLDNRCQGINDEVKDFLVNQEGWHDKIPEMDVEQFGRANFVDKQADMPESTLWKITTPDTAILDFKNSLNEYNVNHGGNGGVLAKGRVVAISGWQYEAFKKD